MVKGNGEPCLSAVIQYRAERRPDRPADKEDTYGGYDMHFSLYTTLCPLQNVIPMLQIGFSGALRLIPTHFLRLPGIESAEETVCASRNASAVLSFAAHHCREQACPFRLLWFRRQFPVGLTQQTYRYRCLCATEKTDLSVPPVASTCAVNIAICSRGFAFCLPLRSLRGRCHLW